MLWIVTRMTFSLVPVPVPVLVPVPVPVADLCPMAFALWPYEVTA